jgi:hypothetical protein
MAIIAAGRIRPIEKSYALTGRATEIVQSAQQQGYRPDYGGIRLLAGARNLSLVSNTQSGSGTHQNASPGVYRPKREADVSPPTSAEVKNDEVIPPLPHTSSYCSA